MCVKANRLVLGVGVAALFVALGGTWWVISVEGAWPAGHSPVVLAAGQPGPAVSQPVPADQPAAAVRSVTTAESVLAVWRHPGGPHVTGPGDPGLILAAWPDGRVVWSGDRVAGSPPYRTGRVDPTRVADVIARFEQDGLFADKKLTEVYLGPGSPYLSILIRSGKKHIDMASWHEVYEVGGRLVEDGLGIRGLEGRPRLAILRESQADWLFYRFVWSETKGKLIDLIPAESLPTDGKPFMDNGELYWREPATPSK